MKYDFFWRNNATLQEYDLSMHEFNNTLVMESKQVCNFYGRLKLLQAAFSVYEKLF